MGVSEPRLKKKKKKNRIADRTWRHKEVVVVVVATKDKGYGG